ncbi:proline-rich protein 4-like [Triticum dicoccoides]|uniref:proline-rich protein 4-like n=1 Tax=Triticum dicoccoides TaxID=85692 RepID=UPI00188ECA43|nr:proline-rich protein 4-like [Triticum dicoccoides]
MAVSRALVLGVLLAIAVANAEAASVVVGQVKCADCTRKNLKAEEAFKDLQVAIKCKNVHRDYESKAVGALDRTGAFSVPLAADLHGADYVAQLHSAASNAPCSGQEPSKIVPVSEGTTFGIMAGANTATPSAASPECASMTLCGPIKKHIIEHFHHKKPVLPKPEPKPQPHPDYGPVPKPEPKPQPQPDYHPVPPTPTYGGGGGGGYHGHH